MEDLKKCRAVNAFFPIYIIAYVGLSILLAVMVQKSGINIPGWAQYVVSEVIALIPALIYILLFKENVPSGISYKMIRPMDALLALLTGYACIPMILFISNLSSLFVVNHLQETSGGLLQYPFAVQILIIAVIPPVVEEFIFRGLFFHTYRKVGILAGALMSGMVFGLFHLNINQFFYASVMGIVFAYLVEATGSMWASMLAHFAVNTYSIGIFKLLEIISAEGNGIQDQLAAAESVELSRSVVIGQLGILAVFAVGFLMLAFRMIRRMAVRNGRQEHLKLDAGGFRALISWPLVLTAVFCVIYMIVLEI